MILLDPWIHRYAILKGYESEKLSLLCEDVLRLQCERLEKPCAPMEIVEQLVQKFDMVKYSNGSIGYEMEEFINHKLGLMIGDLLRVKGYNILYASASSARPPLAI